jgi:glycosyltransferase involved in cell wall biosynthesis
LRSDLDSHRTTDIALVIDTLERGGAEQVLVSIANGLEPRQFRAHVIATREPGPLAGALTPDVVVHSLQRRSRWDLQAIARFADVVQQNEIRLVHTHSHTVGYFVRLARLLRRQRWLHVMHEHAGTIERSTPLRLMDLLFLRHVDYCFAVSEPLARYVVNWVGVPATRCERLLNGVRVVESGPPAKAPVFTIAQVGRVVREKNQEVALAVAARLRADLPIFRWLFIGRTSSAYARRCRDAAHRLGLNEHVVFLGEREDVSALLAAAHVGVLTSRDEGLPIALLEYMAARLPVVVTDVGECGATVRASGGGAVVSAADVDGFAGALRHFAVHSGAAAQAGTANYQYVQAHYTAEAMVRRVAEVYQALLSGGSDRR